MQLKVKVRDSGCKHTLFRPFSIVGPLQFSITNDWTLLRDIHDEQHIHKTLRTSACAERLARKLRILFLKL